MTDAQHISEGLLAGLAAEVLDRDARVVSAIAESNAYNWRLVDSQVTTAAFTDASADAVRFEATLQIAGEQDADRPRAGDRFVVAVRGTAVHQDGTWAMTGYEVVDLTDPSSVGEPLWATEDDATAVVNGADLMGSSTRPLPPSAID